VRLEEQSLPLTISLPRGPHVRTARRDFFDLDPEAGLLQIICDEPCNARLVAIRLFGTVDARDTDEFPCQAHEFIAINLL
jgi:hypothetical protein